MSISISQKFDDASGISDNGLKEIEANIKSALQAGSAFMVELGDALKNGQENKTIFLSLVGSSDTIDHFPSTRQELTTPAIEKFKTTLLEAGLSSVNVTIEFGLGSYHVNAHLKGITPDIDAELAAIALGSEAIATSLTESEKQEIEKELKEGLDESSLLADLSSAQETKLKATDSSFCLRILPGAHKLEAFKDYIQNESPTTAAIRDKLLENGAHSVDWGVEFGIGNYHLQTRIHTVEPEAPKQNTGLFGGIKKRLGLPT